ncbi:hypothetical protein J4480_05405 [Candidatus Woesearchaeota archaeon]|nr:hypothetical protein [Candidatus Woesearchaeota archaeon]
MDKKTKLYVDRKTFILDSIKNGKKTEEVMAINFLQDELHDVLYSYINGGFSKKGFIFYPLVKDLSGKNKNRINDMRIIAGFLNENNHDFSGTLNLFKKNKLNAGNAPLFISSFYKDFSNIKKPEGKCKKIKCKKFNFNDYNKEDSKYLEPVLELNSFAKDKLNGYLVDFHIHGSIATKDYIKGWSDLDTLIIIKKSVLGDAELLISLRDLLYKSKKYFYKIDPLQHHGHMAITEHDLDYYCQAFFPLQLFKYSKSVFGNKILDFKIRDGRMENINRFYFFVDYFKNLYENEIFNLGSYELKNFFHAITLFPTMYLQAKGVHIYKKFSFAMAKEDFGKKLWEPIDAVSKIRKDWKTPNEIPFVDRISGMNPLFAYQINSRYWDLFNGIGRLNNIDIKKLLTQMSLLAENAWNKIKI